jgi:hypothetical protein
MTLQDLEALLSGSARLSRCGQFPGEPGDPDHDPQGARQECRAIQLGLRGEMLRRLGTSELREVLDLSDFVAAQRRHVEAGRFSELRTPREAVYRPRDPDVAAGLDLDSHG